MNVIDREIEEYAEQHTTAESEILYQLNRQTHLKVLHPRMLSGHIQGRTLSMISKMIQPKRILEIGTYTGYSAICLAEGLSKGGKLITIDIKEELQGIVHQYIKEAGFQDQIETKIGNALEVIPQLDSNFDLVFIDADKKNYLKYYNLLIEEIPKGAFLIADNVLWSGKVIRETKENDKDTAILKEFNDKIQQDKRVENVLLPIRDGLMIIRKK